MALRNLVFYYLPWYGKVNVTKIIEIFLMTFSFNTTKLFSKHEKLFTEMRNEKNLQEFGNVDFILFTTYFPSKPVF